jgi:hypothetical protein
MAKGGGPKGSRLLDLRFVIALLFLILGGLVTAAGFFTDDEAIARSGGININLWTGAAMLLLSGAFFLWLVRAPAEVARSREEIREAHLDQEWGEQDAPQQP